MIRIERDSVTEPERLAIVRDSELSRLRGFFESNKRLRSQQKATFETKALSSSPVRNALIEMSHSKCAYCESLLKREVVVDQFRPRAGALRDDGRIDADHYWWLAYDWENLLPSCYVCSRNKGRRFPISGRAAEPEARGRELADEQPLLIDPTLDFPDEHLWVDASGNIAALSPRGDVTIAVLDLNRDELVAGRSEAYATARSLFQKALSENLSEEIDRQLRGELPFTLARRSAYEAVSETAPPVAAKREQSLKYSKVQESVPESMEPASFANWITGLETRNFLGLREFKLDFAEPADPEQEPWIILLGTNGIGKSSILKAVGLALATPDIREKYYPDGSVFLNRETAERTGFVRIHFNRGQPLELRFRKWNKEFTTNREPPQLNLLGYGATRLPPPIGRSDQAEPTRFRVGNLFDPWEVLSDAEKWLTDTSRVHPEQFGQLARSLRELLDLDASSEIIRYRGRIYVKSEKARIPLRQLSDGYQSVVALAMDIMLNLAHDWTLMETAEGTVLLDEIEVHLHPQWKVNIVRSLRRLFPKLRFITTTHDPLCLRGALAEEVHVLDRDADGNVHAIRTDIPPGTRADQVLTGDWFGLSTTIDQETIDLMEEHRRMLLLPSDAQDPKRRSELVGELRDRLGSYADTSIDQLALSAAAEVIGERDVRSLSASERKTARENILRMVREKST